MNNFDDFDVDRDELVFTTGVVSKLIGVPVWVLKRLDQNGIVSPPREDRCARLYSKRHVSRIQYVWNLMQNRGVGLNGIKVIIEIEERHGNI